MTLNLLCTFQWSSAAWVAMPQVHARYVGSLLLFVASTPNGTFPGDSPHITPECCLFSRFSHNLAVHRY